MKNFWDYKAKSYPSPFDEDGLQTPIKVLNSIKTYGVEFKNKSVLDIGCGTGLYGSLLAKDAKNITGVDISKGMLEKFEEYINFHNIENIQIFEKDFKEFDKNTKFDIVLSAMTPAISSSEDLQNMMSFSNNTCIIVSFSGKRYSPIMDNVLSKLGVDEKINDKFGKTKQYLKENGYNYYEDYFDHNWTIEGSVEEIATDIEQHLMLRKIQKNKEMIIDYVRDFEKDGKVLKETFSQIGVLVWNV